MPATAFAADAPADQLVNVVAYGCAFDGAATVTVLLQNRPLFGPRGKELHVPGTIAADGGLTFSFRAPAGPLNWFFFWDSKKCQNVGGGLIVLPGHDRHVVTSVQTPMAIADWHAAKFVAGTMPSVPVGVSVVTSESGDCPDESAPAEPATIDGGAYYAGYMRGKHLFLELRSAGFERLYIALPDATPAESHDQFVRRDITQDNLKLLTTHALNHDVQCIKEPSGTSTRFDQ